MQVDNLEKCEVTVSAQGPETVPFQGAQTDGATHSTRLQTAGMYLVHVAVNGHPLSGWPRSLHVTAAASEAARSARACPAKNARAKHSCLRAVQSRGDCSLTWRYVWSPAT